MNILKKPFLLVTMVLCTLTVLAQDSIDNFVQLQMQQRRIPGLQLAIVKNGQIIKTGNYGYANLQDSILVNDNTVFTINSITKAFTGVAIIQLMEAGRLKLKSPVSEYLTDLPLAWQQVTVQQLLSHTSGIPDMVDEEESVLIAGTAEAAWKKVIQLPNDFSAGEKFRYNQTNYLLLGRILDKLSGMPFQEFITKEQLAKGGMTKTIRSGFGATKEIIPHAANSYQFSKGKLNNMFFSFPSALQTAANWIIALQKLQLVKQPSSLQTLWAPAILNNGKIGGFSSSLNGYAAGWPVIKRTSHPAVAPVGGGRSALLVYPNDDLSIIVLTNLSGGFPEQFIDEIAGFYIPDMKEANGFGLSPSVKLLKSSLEKEGYKNAIATVKKLKASNSNFNLTENEINSWGYKLIKQKRMADALEIFKLNVHLFPASANVYDSLGEIYAEYGEPEQAIKNYEQSLKLDPQNRNAAEQIKRLKSNK